MSDRMFHVIVLGGIGLAACGGMVNPDSGREADGAVPADAAPLADAGEPTDAPFGRVFPSELPAFIADSGDTDGASTESPDASAGGGDAANAGSAEGGLTGGFPDATDDYVGVPIELPR